MLTAPPRRNHVFPGGQLESMPDVQAALQSIAAARKDDPLAPVTFVVPSHVAGLQLRRRLAGMGPLAGVRFEALPPRGGAPPASARALRQMFRRLRRGGVRSSRDASAVDGASHLAEVLRLYDRFREETAAFYDEEDLLGAGGK